MATARWIPEEVESVGGKADERCCREQGNVRVEKRYPEPRNFPDAPPVPKPTCE
jgi:hypothetical protein